MNQAVFPLRSFRGLCLKQGHLGGAPVLFGVVVGDDQLLVPAAGLVGHAVGAVGAVDVEILVQLPDEAAVVVGNHDKAPAVPQDSVEAGVVPHGEFHRVAVLGLVVGWVAVEVHAVPVVLPDQG